MYCETLRTRDPRRDAFFNGYLFSLDIGKLPNKFGSWKKTAEIAQFT